MSSTHIPKLSDAQALELAAIWHDQASVLYTHTLPLQSVAKQIKYVVDGYLMGQSRLRYDGKGLKHAFTQMCSIEAPTPETPYFILACAIIASLDYQAQEQQA